MTPSVEAAARLADELDTTVGFLIGETRQAQLFKDPQMMRRLDGISQLTDEDRQCAFRLIDALIRDAQAQFVFA